MYKLSSEVVAAIKSNNVPKLKALQCAGETFLGRYGKRDSPFLLAAKWKSVEAFDFLLRVENIIDVVDFRGCTPLIAILQARYDDSEEFCLKLVENGCDIHLIDHDGSSALHYAISYRLISVSEALIERGADLNCRDRLLGRTPLYIACEKKLVDEVFMLLFYGADPVIATNWGHSSLDLLPKHNDERVQTFFYEKLYPHYKTIRLDTFIYLMEHRFSRFSRLIEMTDDITFDFFDLGEFSRKISRFCVKSFKLFVEKFGYIMEEVIDNVQLSEIFFNDHIVHYIENLYTIFDSNLAPRLGQAIKDKKESAIYEIFLMFYQHHEGLDIITKLSCCLMSHGVDPNADEINEIFCEFGYCELFEIMLHMDIQPPVKNNYSLNLMPMLIYGVDMTIEKCLATTAFNTNNLHDVLRFFSTPALKTLGLSLNEDDITTRISELPAVPTLVELARNKARVHIVKTFKIKNSGQFYTLLKRLPIARVYKEIIAFKRELYPLQQK